MSLPAISTAPPREPVKIYTDAAALHPNLFVGSFQILFWLLFHPSAWRHYVTRIDAELSPDFTLSQLDRAQWRNPQLHRLLWTGYVILPVTIGVVMGLVPWWRLTDVSSQDVMLNALVGILNGLFVGLAIGLTANVGLGIVYGAMLTVVTGLINIPQSRLLYGMVISSFTTGTTDRPEVLGGIIQGLLFSAIASVAASVAVGTTEKKDAYPLLRQISGFVLGILISGIVLVMAQFVVDNAGPIGQGLGFVKGSTYGAVGGTLFGLAFMLIIRAQSHKWHRGLAIGLLIGLIGGTNYGIVVATLEHSTSFKIASGIAAGLMFGGLFALPYVLAQRTAGIWAAAVAGALVAGIGWVPLSTQLFPDIPQNKVWPMAPIVILLGLTRTWWQPVILYPILTIWNFLLFRLDERQTQRQPSFLRFHSVFWDEHQRLPLLDLSEHLVLIAERNPSEGQVAIDYVSTTRQRWAAQAAQIELEARWLEDCTTVEAIGTAHRSLSAGELAGPASALLRSFSSISQDVLAALRQESIYNQRLTLRLVEDRLDNLLRELNRSSERYAVRFIPIAARWREIVAQRNQELAKTVELRQEIDSPYIIGVPLTEQQEIFIGRVDVSARIEQLLRDKRHLPLLLYGQRRMGKTSLLNNLGRLLPSTLIPLFIDLQGPPSQAADHIGFLYNLARGMSSSAQRQRGLTLPRLSREILATDPFTAFDEWLDEVEAVLGENTTALLALDEFESLEIPIAEGRFSEAAVMGMFRHLIQHRPRFKVLLTGSHSLDGFGHWSSYLINVQMVHISYLSEAEARQLIERPVKNFALNYEPAASRRVIELTRGHPFLVQLLCSEIVGLKNEQQPAERRLARLADVEAAVPRALEHGSFFFADIQHNQLNEPALAVLGFIAKQSEDAPVDKTMLSRQFPDDLDEVLSLLVQRELIESIENEYCFQVELIRRWFAQG